MSGSQGQPDLVRPSNAVTRKKLLAELRATEEIARIKQNVIEKRLAVELATLNEEKLDESKCERESSHQKLSLKPLLQILPKATTDQIKTKSSKKSLPLLTSDSRKKGANVKNDGQAESEELLIINGQSRKRSAFFKGIMTKFKRRLNLEENDQD